MKLLFVSSSKLPKYLWKKVSNLSFGFEQTKGFEKRGFKFWNKSWNFMGLTSYPVSYN